MKNILYLHAGAEMYGADKILLELVTGLDKKKFKPIVILPNKGILKDRLEEVGIETYVIDYPILRRKYFTPKGIFNYVRKYRQSCQNIIRLLDQKRYNIDIIHINTTAVLEGIYLKKELNAKLVWHVHEILLKPKLVAKTINHLVGRYSDQVVVVSKAVKDHLIKSGNVENDKVTVIYNGVDSEKFKPGKPTDYLFKEWQIPKNAIKVGMIGRVNAWKGQNEFLEAAKILLAKNNQLYFFIIGSAFAGQEWRVDELRNNILQIPDHNRIKYSEYRSDTPELDDFFDLLVLPSTNPDPLPTVVLEAMSSGTAVVGYRHGGVTEMVNDTVTGYLAEVNNPMDLAKKIELAISNNLEQLGKNARERILTKFSEDNFIKSFEDIYSN